VPQWVNAICEGVVADLTALEKPFKYMVTCVIMQRNGAGIHTANSCFYDTVNDGMAQYKWPKEKQNDQKTMYCIVTVFGTLF
jgi:dynein light chain Tctex-type 1